MNKMMKMGLMISKTLLSSMLKLKSISMKNNLKDHHKKNKNLKNRQSKILVGDGVNKRITMIMMVSMSLMKLKKLNKKAHGRLLEGIIIR